jgi:hypothetical protein
MPITTYFGDEAFGRSRPCRIGGYCTPGRRAPPPPYIRQNGRNVIVCGYEEKHDRIAPEIQEQILKRIREEEVPVTRAAKEHGVSEATKPRSRSSHVRFRVNEKRIILRIMLRAEELRAYLRAVLCRRWSEAFPYLGFELRFERPSRRPASRKILPIWTSSGTVFSRQY